MTKNNYPVLCGGTFLALLLNARKSRTSKRDNAQGGTDGLSQIDLLIELVRIVKPNFDPPAKESTLKKNVGNYRQCIDNGGSSFEAVWHSENDVINFKQRHANKYNSVLADMIKLTNRFIDESKTEWLVKAIIETINGDLSIDRGYSLNFGEKVVIKSDLPSIDDVNLPAFLLEIWRYIVTNVKDNTVGQATFKKWHKQKGDTHSEWLFDGGCGIGTTITRKITVLPFETVTETNFDDSDKKDDVCNSSEFHSSAEATADTDPKRITVINNGTVENQKFVSIETMNGDLYL
jgi:hypothetical protein